MPVRGTVYPKSERERMQDAIAESVAGKQAKLDQFRQKILNPSLSNAATTSARAGALADSSFGLATTANQQAGEFGSLVKPMSELSAEASRGQGALNPEDFTEVGGVGSVLGDVLGTPFGLLEDAQSGLGDIFGTRSGHDREKARAIIDTFNSFNPEGAIEPREFNTGNVVVDQMREWNRPESADLQYGVQKIKELRDEEKRRLANFYTAAGSANQAGGAFRSAAGTQGDADTRAVTMGSTELNAGDSFVRDAVAEVYSEPQAAATLASTIAGTERAKGVEERDRERFETLQAMDAAQLAGALTENEIRIENLQQEKFDTLNKEEREERNRQIYLLEKDRAQIALRQAELDFNADEVLKDPARILAKLAAEQAEAEQRAKLVDQQIAKLRGENESMPSADQRQQIREWEFKKKMMDFQIAQMKLATAETKAGGDAAEASLKDLRLFQAIWKVAEDQGMDIASTRAMMEDTPGFNSTGIFDRLAIDSADWFPDYDKGAIGDATMTMADPNESDLFPFPQGATRTPAPAATPNAETADSILAGLTLEQQALADTPDGIDELFQEKAISQSGVMQLIGRLRAQEAK
jgi:hypothetical protein